LGCGLPTVWPWRYGNPMFDEKLIAEAARRLSAAAPQAQVILFGSHARGDAGPSSDLDFLVVEPAVSDPAEESVRLRRTLRGLGLFADVVVVSEREAEEWREVRGSLIHSALSEGRPVAA
jgi:predicted nucleotidyltransferase